MAEIHNLVRLRYRKPTTFLAAMQAWDNYFFRRCHPYNVTVAVYIARCRVRSWAAGKAVVRVSEENREHQFHHFRYSTLCRDMPSWSAKVEQAHRELKAMERPPLFLT